MEEISKNTIIGYIIFFIIIIGTSFVGIYTVGKIREGQQQKNVVVKQVEKQCQYPDFDAIKGKNPDQDIKPITIARNFINSKPVTPNDLDGVTKNFEVKGQFSRAYLYIEAMVDYKRQLTVWDDVYFKIKDDGGHLISDFNNLARPSATVSNYLYDLRSIYYYPTVEDKKKEGSIVNLFELLKDEKKLKINVFVSSNRPGGVLKEVSIYYQCLPGSTCSIKPIDK